MKRLLLSILLLPLLHSPAYSFDNDREIDAVDFNTSIFLDLKAMQFRPALERRWLQAENRFRISGGSISGDKLALRSQLHLKHALSEHADVAIEWQEETFYARKPTLPPQLEIGIHPWPQNVSISVLGTASYDKRQGDLGAAFTLGQRTEDYFRFKWLEQDIFYNEKNVFDDSFYQQRPRVLGIESAYQFNPRWHSRLFWENSRQLKLVLDDGFFKHESNEVRFALDYHYTARRFSGIRFRQFSIDKTRTENEHTQQQKLNFRSAELLWNLEDSNREYTYGIIYDRFDDRLQSLTPPSSHTHYTLSSWQTYASFYSTYTSNMAWGLAIYLATVTEQRETLGSDPSKSRNRVTEAKLRLSWEYRSVDEKSTLTFHFSFNIDDLANDLGDGGAISYQLLL